MNPSIADPILAMESSIPPLAISVSGFLIAQLEFLEVKAVPEANFLRASFSD